MAKIARDFGQGGANLNPGGTGSPTLAGALRDIADDLTALQFDVDALNTAGTHGLTLTSATLLTEKV